MRYAILIRQWSDSWRQGWHYFILMEQVWPGHHEIAWEMAMAGDVLLGCLQAKGYATQLQPMHALIPSIF